MKQSQSPENEIASLTSIRGMAAVWVVLFHFSEELFRTLPEFTFLKPLLRAGGLAVPLFFILSGYVLGLRYRTKLSSPRAGAVLRFWVLRLGRIYPVHICTLAISLCLVARHGWPTQGGYTVASFVANCLLIHAWNYDFHLSWNYPSWSISSEWFAYLIFPLVAAFLGRAGRKRAVPLVIVACAMSAIVYAFEEDLKFKGLVVVLPTFVGGVGLAITCPPSGSPIRLRPLAELGLLSVVLLPYAIDSGPLQKSMYLVFFFVLIAALGMSGNHSAAFWRSRPLIYLGDISYSLYMTHAITITLLTRFFPFDALRSHPMAVRIAAMMGCFVTILGVTAGMYHMVERPMRELTRRLGATPKTVASPLDESALSVGR